MCKTREYKNNMDIHKEQSSPNKNPNALSMITGHNDLKQEQNNLFHYNTTLGLFY